MNVCVIGAGYVGLTTSAVLADLGNNVYCIEKESDKVDMLRRNEMPIFEPKLAEMVRSNQSSGNLTFSTNFSEAVKKSSIIFITVGTPSSPNGSPNLSFLKRVIADLTPLINSYKTIVIKSTVPLGTNENIHRELVKNGVSPDHYDVVSNPEFLREGSAIDDMLHPDKIVIGVKRLKPIEHIQKLYQPIQAPYIITSLTGAEMIKYASNAFLAMKISFINELSRISEAYSVDITEVALGLGTDPRIGPDFLQAGLGYGGSCFPKDLAALEYLALQKQITPYLLQATQAVNENQIDLYVKKLESVFPDFSNRNFTVWGASFKPNTDDVRHSQALKLIERLGEKGCHLHIYDPVVSVSLPNTTTYSSLYDSVVGTDGLIIATEWQQFKEADWSLVKNSMKGDVVLDCRNCVEPGRVKSEGLKYVGVARP